MYACLADMANRDKNYAFPSHKTLAVKTNMSVSSVRRHIDELVQVGALLERKRFKPEGAGQTSNLYTVVHKPMENVNEGVTENNPVLTGEQGGYSPVDNITITNEQKPILNASDSKEHIAKARELLKNNDSF